MRHDSPEFQARMKALIARTEGGFDRWMPAASTRPAVLHEAMLYSLKAGGKRLRPVLLLSAHGMFPSALDPVPAAVAIECLHTYSLIHDDLPCMDNSDLRRGNPTCHKKFDEPTALLAGDALLTHALWLPSHAYRDTPEVAAGLVRDLGDAAGSRKLIGGQMEDIIGERGGVDADRLDFIHLNKTAALLSAAITMGVRLSDAPAGAVDKAEEIGRHVGLAFQIIDDLLDVTSDAATMGKPVGADAGNGKVTYPRLHGIEASRRRAHDLSESAVSLARELGGDADFLVALIRSMEHRIR